MDLVDIDALLGDLELEADNSTSPTSTSQKQTANGHSSSISQLSSISMTSNGHPASVANGNAAASNGGKLNCWNHDYSYCYMYF